MAHSKEFQYKDEIEWQDAGKGLQKQIFGYDQKIMMVKVKFEKGGIGKLHAHPHTQATYVESGVFEITIGDQKKVIRTGDGFYVPPQVVHGCYCIEEGMLIDVFSPMREDFL